MTNLNKIFSGESFNWKIILKKDVKGTSGQVDPEFIRWSPQPDFAMLIEGFPFFVSSKINHALVMTRLDKQDRATYISHRRIIIGFF